MATKTMVAIDGTKLRAELSKRGFKPEQASTEIGYSPTYFYNVFKRETIGIDGLRLLERAFHIRQSDIDPKTEEKEEEKTMPKAKTLNVDPVKLQNELDRRNLTRRIVCQEMGFSHNYVDHIITRGRITLSGMVMLEKLYGITYDNIKIDEPEPVIEEAAEESPESCELTDILFELKEIKLALNKIGALQAELLKAWAPEG